MSLTLNEKEKRSIVAVVQNKLEAHLNHFPYARYPIEPLNEWKRIFCDPKTVPSDTLKKALNWHFGSWQRKDLALAHRKIISVILKFWPEYVEHPAHAAEQSFHFWEQKLSDWHHGFGAVAFLLHLQRPDQYEIADRHRIDAMFSLLKAIDHAHKERVSTLSFLDLQDYTSFFRSTFPKLPHGNESRLKLDRFLKMYGNRHAYKNVTLDYQTKEPSIREFSWEKASSKQFDLKKIMLRSNADVLFACLLLSLEQHSQPDEALTIGRIAEYIPLGTAGICNSASYNYAMISLFGSQKGRDYFQLEGAVLRDDFTDQANQSTRDMKFYAKHADLIVTLNPKYIKKS
ncbi:hypothetical protein [Paenibacillus sp. NEAU-GSW1]|uniref:hypothetical protein n=1 Tax=Paenibacillus sp. NEAU-GSW1 TaxID=2682486 RepID=UPI0012E28BD8|nr:hypothetical protein [Paenibacillus sp. NEAU-GSW1]MUT64924.1 hypothetical protein [Paenibacillus sp. NEAU-GSW1]